MSHAQYEPVRPDDDDDAMRDSILARYTDTQLSDSEEPDTIHKLQVIEPPGNPLNPRSRNRSCCTCRRLSKTCIAACALIVVLVVGSVGFGWFWAYKFELIDGQSPPWYPSPRGGTVSSWAESYNKAQKMVERMTLPEKVNLTTGTGWAMDLCVGTTGAVERLGFPALCLQDGPLGIRFADHATSFPAGVTVGSTWNRQLMRRRGEAHGREAKMKGIHVLLGPAMGPIGRNPAGGRTWEGFGADPVLQAIAANETIRGIQSQRVQATAKHFIGNEQEHFRKSFEWGLPEALSSNIDDRALHEIYAWPFAESVRAGVASVMCAYQMVNNSYACQNSWLMNGILKDELGFQGYVQSDWLAQRSGVASALAGLDMSMPGDGLYWQDGKPLFGTQLTVSVLNTSVPMQRINDMATRIVAAWYQLGQDSWDSDGPNFSSWTDDKIGKWHDAASDSHDEGTVNKFVEASTAESILVAREVAAEGTVLLKNDGNLLPLDVEMSSFAKNRKARVMVIGEDAGPGDGPNHCADRGCNQGTLAVGWGSGATEFTHLVDPLSALNNTFSRKTVDLTASLNGKLSGSVKKQLGEQDLCIVFANADAGEGYLSWNGVRADRNDLELQKDGVNLIKSVADACGGSVIVVIHTVGPVIYEEFADLPKVKAILMANLPGQESGNALTDVLFGKVDASGRLPYTIGRSLEDYGEGAPVLYYPNRLIPQVDFKEGLYIDYRHFDRQNIEPRYAFGYGLSYTTFEYSNLNITSLKPKSKLPSPRPTTLQPPTYSEALPDLASSIFPTGFRKLIKYCYPWVYNEHQIRKGDYDYPDGYNITRLPSQAGGAEGGNPSLFEDHVRLTVEVKNTGSRTGKEVVQVYVSFPDDIKEPLTGEPIDTPPKQLRNFDKIELEPGHTQVVELYLNRKDLSYWSVVQQNWIMPELGDFTISVGQNSRRLLLHGVY